MSLQRITSVAALRRSVALAAQKSPAVSALAVRGYADKPEGEFSEAYNRGTPQGFSKREQASEDYFVRQQEQEKLKALREKLAKQRQHLDEVEQAIDDLHKK